MANPLAANHQHPSQSRLPPSCAPSPSTSGRFSLGPSRTLIGGRSPCPSNSVNLPCPPTFASETDSNSVQPHPLASVPAPAPKCVSRLRSLTGFSYPGSSSSSNLSTPRPRSNTSSSVTIFRPFLRHRGRQLSDSSLTDLSPPTIDSDLDLDFHPPIAESDKESTNNSSPYSSKFLSQSSLKVPITHSHLPKLIIPQVDGLEQSLSSYLSPSPSNSFVSPHPSNSNESHSPFLLRLVHNFQSGASTARNPFCQTSSKEPPKLTDQSQTPPMPLLRSDSTSSNSSCLYSRILNSRIMTGEKTPSPNRNPTSTKLLSRETSSRSFRRTDSLNSLNSFPSTTQQTESQTEVEEIESICTPPKPLWVDTDRAKNMSSVNSSHGSDRSAKSTAASPGLFSTASFSRRPSYESERASFGSHPSPRRCPAPPPIKVPKLRAPLVTVAAEGDSPPITTSTAQNLTRHRATGSESNVSKDRRHAGLGWPALTRHESFSTFAPRLTCEPPSNELDHIEDLARSSSSNEPQISVFGSSKKLLRTLRLAHQAPSDEPARRNCPLLISRHSRSLNSLAPSTRISPTISPISSTVSPSPTPTSADNARIVSVDLRLPVTTQPGSRNTLVSPPKRISLVNAPPPLEPGRCRLPDIIASALPDIPGSSVDNSKILESSFSAQNTGTLPETPRVGPFPSPDSPAERQHRLDSTVSFDVRNLPFTLDNCGEPPTSQPLPISIPQLIAIPQLLPMPAISAIGPISKPDSHSSILPHQSSRQDLLGHQLLRTVGSNISNNSSITTNQLQNRDLTPFSPTESIYSVCSHESLHPRTRSADDLSVPCKDSTPSKYVSRPRSMSDRGPNRASSLLGPQSVMFDSQGDVAMLDESNIRGWPFLDAPLSKHSIKRRPFPWATESIEAHLSHLAPAAQSRTIERALDVYPSHAHRFVVGDVAAIMEEGRQCEKTAQELHIRYLGDLAKREKLLKRHVMTLRAFNGDEGERFSYSLLKAINQSDESISELLSLVNHTSRVERMCEAHWRAAATVTMRESKHTRAALSAAEAKINTLENERAQYEARISDLEAKLRGLSTEHADPQVLAEAERDAPLTMTTSNFLATNTGLAKIPASVTTQDTRPVPTLPRPSMRRLNIIPTENRAMTVYEATPTVGRMQPMRFRTPVKHVEWATPPEQVKDSTAITLPLPHSFERPREPPPVPTCVSSDPQSQQGSPTVTASNLLDVSIPRQEIPKPAKRPGMQFGQAARSLFTSNMRRKPSELTTTKSSGASTSPNEPSAVGQFATWSPELSPRSHEPLNTIFKPMVITSEPIVQEKVFVPQIRPSNPSHFAPQIPPTQTQLSPPPPPPTELLSVLPNETPASRRHVKWARPDGTKSPGPSNLTSITLSQLGSLDIAQMLTDFKPPPTPKPPPLINVLDRSIPSTVVPSQSSSSLLA